MSDIHFDFTAKQELFSELLNKTMGTPHGTFPLQQEDDSGCVWEFQFPLSKTLAWRLLWEASGTEAPTNYVDEGVRTSILPRQQEYVIFSGDDNHLWSLYQSNGRYYIMRANGKRYFDLVLRGKLRTSAAHAVYETLRPIYGELPQAPTLQE